MPADPFLFSSPQELLEKARRDLHVLRTRVNPDTVFNFFVTAFHVMDYVRSLKTVDPAAIEAMFDDWEFRVCHAIAVRDKHLDVTRNPRPFGVELCGGSMPGASPVAADALGTAPTLHLTCDGRAVDLVRLAASLIQKWEQFFDENGIE